MSTVVDIDAGYWALRGSGAAVVVDRDVVAVTGPDAVPFLQGQLSQDLAALPIGESAWSFLLEPRGRVDAWVRCTVERADTVLIDVEAGFGAAVAARLERFRVRTRADLDLTPSWSMVAVRAAGVDGPVPTRAPGTVVAPVRWPGGVCGLDWVTPAPADPGDRPRAPLPAFEAVRIECGVPALGRELTAASLPAESGPWAVEASVSFTKGCYTGQELVARMEARRAPVPRPVRGLVITGAVSPDRLPQVGDVVADGTGELGTLTSVAWSPDQQAAVALAPLARRVEPPARLEVVGADARYPAAVRDLPLFTAD